MVLGGSLPPHQLAAGGLPPGRGAAGSRPKYKTPLIPSRPHFLPTRSREGERRGEGGNSTGEALPDFGSESQVTNISQLCHSRFFVCLIL